MAVAPAPTPSASAESVAPLPIPLDAVHAELARRKLSWFFRLSWPILEPKKVLIWNWHLEVVCDHVQALLEGRIPQRNIAINVPPGSSKSRIVSVCSTAWWWIDHPEWRGIFTSANPRNVLRDSVYCRQIIESQWYQDAFRPEWTLAEDQNAKGLYRNTRGGFRQAVGSSGGVTGDRADGLFMDDMLDATEGESAAAREAFVIFYDQAFANRVSSMTEGTRCIIAQRLHEMDPVGHLLQSGDWDHLKIRQEYSPPTDKDPLKPTSLGWVDPRTEPGELMDPVRFPAVELAKEKRRLGTRGYSAQHQQDPAAAEGNILKRAWFRTYKTPRGPDGEPLPPHLIVKALGITRVVQAVDTALSEKKSADFTAHITGGEAPSRVYLLDLILERMAAPTTMDTIKLQHAKWAANAVVVEGGSSASGKAIAQTIRHDTRLPIIEMPVQTDKVVGMNAIAPTVEANVVYIPEDQPWSADLIESLVKFPVAPHDDDADAFRILVWYSQFGGAVGMGMFEWMRQQAAAREAERVAAAAGESVPVAPHAPPNGNANGNGNGNGAHGTGHEPLLKGAVVRM